ncbi:long-chain-fatty-acid--CoA ligase [Roseateles koreensis]|uniref:Long-chain-fatty-acid--CoA ligase n=1 Tax=Roseateles koreensis TaxID=2987526 RepID=A0ABT5KQ99_9BURK|nr:long-chain-fatty-acid--CoA ligase [Roseateles koreensis]MDC8784553.1 long-chain-fatty-acid--CoA ligase [Roseateles koreensis]
MVQAEATVERPRVSPPAESKPWLKTYPPGVPADIDGSAYGSLVDLLEETFSKYADRDAAECMNQSLSFSQVGALSRDLAAWLQSLGLPRGARVAIMMPNILQYTLAVAAILRAGYVVVNVNPLYTPRELSHQLKDSGAQAIIVLENFASTLEQVLDQTEVRHVVLASLGDMLGWWRGPLVNFMVRHVKKMVPEFCLPADVGRSVTRFNAALQRGSGLPLQPMALGPDDVAFLQYTGGTTGISKGATLLHRNVVANILQSEAWFAPTLKKLGDKPLTIVCALPLYHVFALTACYMLGARLGMKNLLIPNPRDIPGMIETLHKHKVNVFPAVNTLFNALANDPNFARLDFSELVISNGGGMAVQQATAEKWLKLTGCSIVEGYGLSETSPVTTINRLDLLTFNGSIGLPVPGTDIAIRDDDGKDLRPGERGEICIRGPQVMAGYWNRPDETALVMTPDGYFKSGDIGVMDTQGYVRIVDRKKDMILVSGFNVYPTEIEQVANMHPGVRECAAVGVPDPRSGEAVKLYVVKNDPALAEEDLSLFCHDQLTAYKRPKYIEFRDDLPKTNVGKILRRELRS